MNLIDADEESLTSPVLTVNHHSSAFAPATFQNRKLESENSKDGPSSPVLLKNETQKSKPGKADFHWPLMVDDAENFSGNFLKSKDVEPHFSQPESKKDFQKNDRYEGVCSPELGAKKGCTSSSDSSEIKRKKTHLNLTTARKKRTKLHAVTNIDSHSERNSLASENTSSTFLSPQKKIGSRLDQENQYKPLQNIVKNLDTKIAKSDQVEGYYSLNKSAKNPTHASEDTINVDKVEIKSQRLCEKYVFGGENSSIFGRSEKSKEKATENVLKINSMSDCCQESDVSNSPILNTKSLTSGKEKRLLNNKEKELEQGAKFFVSKNNPSKRNLFTGQSCPDVLKTAPNASPKFAPRIFSFKSNKCGTHLSVGPKTHSTFSPSSATHEVSTGHACSKNLILSPSKNLSLFDDKSSAVSSSNMNLSSVSKRLSFHTSSTEKKRNKGMKAQHKLKLKKTNHLENQFSKFSEFCKVNTSLSTKSPSNLMIRKSKMKKFHPIKEESSFRKSSNYSESYCDFDGSLSPVLEPCVNAESKFDIMHNMSSVPEKIEDPLGKHQFPQDNKTNQNRRECSIEDHMDDKLLSPCLRAFKSSSTNPISSEMSSKFSVAPKKSSKKFKFSLDSETTPGNTLDNNKEGHNLNESLSPVLEVHKNMVPETNQNAVKHFSEVDHEDSHIIKTHDISVTAENDESALDDRKILNATILETDQDLVDQSSTFDIGVDDDVDCSQAASAISKSDQGQMAIEFSESSGTQRSRISDGYFPCDEERTDKIPSTPQKNLPLNDDDIYESGKKKICRYRKGTLSARLNKLLNRMKSETRIWAHEEQDDLPSSAAIDLVVDIVTYEMNRWLLKCRIISKSSEDECCDVYFVLLHPTAISNALVSPGIVLRVFPKWQTLDLSSPKVTVIFNVNRVKIIQYHSSAHSSNFAPHVKQNIQVAKSYCSCPRDSVLSVCVHNLLRRQILLGPLISPENKQ